LRIGMLALDPDGHPQVSALCAALLRAGHEVVAYHPKDDSEPPAGVRAESIPVDTVDPIDPGAAAGRFADAATFGAELAAHLAAAPPDLLHAHDVPAGVAARAAIEGNPMPVVQTLPRAGMRDHSQARLGSSLQYLDAQRAVARDATALLALSAAQGAWLVSQLKKRRDAVTVVPYGVDFGVFCPSGPAFGRTPRARVLAVGGERLTSQGFGTLVRAMGAVPDAELLICAGPDDGGSDAAVLREYAARARVADRFRLTGALDPAGRAAAYRSADVVACTPTWTAFGQYALEAMACGRPVVATATGGLPDVVVDGATGMLVPPDRPRRLAAALRKLVGEPFWRDAYGTAGLDRAQARYSWDQVGADTLAVYEHALGSRGLDTAPADPDGISE
jgi:D-inositol-3-phosphate glycosyltransferase